LVAKLLGWLVTVVAAPGFAMIYLQKLMVKLQLGKPTQGREGPNRTTHQRESELNRC
jgi:hypothetical protein